jgi:hypothetical protein
MAGTVSRMHVVKMARVIFMASSYGLIAIDPVKTADFEHDSYQLRCR